MSESVNIIIDADDLASAKVAAAARNVDQNIKAIKSSGEQAKKSTEFFGVIAGSLGGSELASYASQLGAVTEKTSQFAEVQKLGGAGALAFKAGLVGVAGVVGFQIGTAIGNAIFQTEDWTKKLEEATAKAKELSSEAAKIQMMQFSDKRETIEIFQDPKAKEAGYRQLLDETKKNLEGVEKQAASSKKALDEYSSTAPYNPFSDISSARQQLEQDRERVKVLTDQKLELEKLVNPQQEQNRLLRERLELDKQAESNVAKLKEEIDVLNGKVKVLSTEEAQLIRKRDLLKETKQKDDASTAFIRQLREEVALLKVKKEDLASFTANQKTSNPNQAGLATALLQERDMLKQKQDAEKAAIEQKEREAQRITDLKQKELDKLAEEQVLLTKGKEAAHAFSLEKQGLSKVDAANIARQQAQNDALKAQQTAKLPAGGGTQINQAFEARLLTRGSGGDPQADTAKNTAAMLAEQKRANQIAEKNRQETRIKVLKAGA